MPRRDTAWPDGTPCWIDLMTSDVDSAAAFYGGLFGWQMTGGSAETGGYLSATVDGDSVAGIGPLQMDHPPVWTTYLATGDVDATADAIVRAGGVLVAPTMDVMDLGRMAVVQDASRGTFALWQAGTMIGVARYNEPNTLVWNEYLTRDYDAAKELFAAAFGYTYTEIGDDQFQYSMIQVDGNTVGGLGVLPPDVPPQVPPHWRAYIDVEDADAACERAVALGGSVVRPPQDMPYGRHADIADPQGATLAVITPPSS